MDHDRTRLKMVNTRQSTINSSTVVWLLFFSLLLIGCETTRGPAPVVERTVVPGKAAEVLSVQQAEHDYIVQSGDTLYIIGSG